MKKLFMAVPVIVILIALVIIGCTNKGLIGPAPDTGDEVVSSCVYCHTDEALLEEVAAVIEETASEETTGEG
jgi:hypothetical protein